MISNEKKKAMYKKALAALLATTTTLGLAGCGGNEETPKDDKVEEPADTNDQNDKLAYLPSDVMSKEETQQLALGTRINVEDLKKLPDELALEDAEMSMIYIYKSTATTEDGNTTEYENRFARPAEMDENGEASITYEGVTNTDDNAGIEIAYIASYLQDDNGVWNKYVEIDGTLTLAGPVISEDKIEMLNGSQKTLK